MGKTNKNERWWNATEDQLHTAAWEWADAVAQANSWRLERNRLYRRLYQRLDPDMSTWTSNPGGWSGGFSDSSVKYNLVSSCVDTAASIIAQLKPVPTYQTDLGNWDLQRIVRGRTRVLDGLFWDLDIHSIGTKVFYGGACSDFGAAYVFNDRETGKPKVELVNSYELDIDYNDAMYGRPGTIMRRHFIDREKLKGMYKFAFIEDADGPSHDDFERFFMSSDTRSDQVRVLEAWHLPSFDGAGDGRHVLVTSNGCLLDEEYTCMRHRFPTFSWKPNINGNIYGTSISEEVLESQKEINRHIKKVLEQQIMMTNGYVLVREGSKVKADKITNFSGQVLSYQGEKPEWRMTNGTPMDLQDQIERIEKRVYKQLGIAPGSIQGTREPGLNSGAALREMQDIKSQRHVMNARAFIKFYMDLSQCLIDVLDESVQENPDLELNAIIARGKSNFLESTKWADLQVEEDKARFYIADISNTPTTPQGKLENIEDFLRMGFIDRPWAMKELQMADTNAYTALETAPLEFALWQMEQLSQGEDVFPYEYADLALCGTIAQKSLQWGQMNGMTTDIQWKFRNYLREVDRLTAKATPPPPPPQAAPAAAAPTSGSPMG